MNGAPDDFSGSPRNASSRSSRAGVRASAPSVAAGALVALAVVFGAILAATPSPAPTPTTAPTLAATLPPSSGSCGTLQARIDAAPAGSVLDLAGCTYTAGAVVRKPLTISGATVRPSAGTTAVVVAANDVTLDGLHIIGPQATTFNGHEHGVLVGASVTAPVRNLTIRNCEIANFGYSGAWLRHVVNPLIQNNRVHDLVYAGIMILSGQGGRIEGNVVQRVGVLGSEVNEGNAYGIALSRIAGGLATEPVTADVTVTGNTVEDVPTWHALDTHAGRRIVFTNNTVRRSSRALFITRDGEGNRATNITVTGNYFLSPAPVTFNLTAVTTYDTVNVTITGNTASGWPEGLFFTDYQELSVGLSVASNACDRAACSSVSSARATEGQQLLAIQ